MPILGEQVQIAFKLMPLTLESDSSCRVTIRRGYITADGAYTVIDEKIALMTTEETASVLDAPPVAGLSRRDDLSFAVYMMLVAKGLVAGQVV